MKKLFLALALFLAAVSSATAKNMKVPEMYMFGFAASFNDTIVHFTNIQTLKDAWVDSKTKFLLARDSYSYQLREYLANSANMPHRTCVVVYGDNKAKIAKKYAKMKRLYTYGKDGLPHFDARLIGDKDFAFKVIDMSAAEEKPEAKPEKQQKKKRE